MGEFLSPRTVNGCQKEVSNKSIKYVHGINQTMKFKQPKYLVLNYAIVLTGIITIHLWIFVGILIQKIFIGIQLSFKEKRVLSRKTVIGYLQEVMKTKKREYVLVKCRLENSNLPE